MGGQLAYQINNISQDSCLNEIRVTDNINLSKYINFLVKINKKIVNEQNFSSYIENRKDAVEFYVKEISIYNILLKKEFSILIDTVSINNFLSGLTLNYTIIPTITKLIIIKEIFSFSPAKSEGLKEGNIVLCAKAKNNMFYLEGIGSIAHLIKIKSCFLIFYDILKDSIVEVDFEKYRSDVGALKLGFSVEEVDASHIYKMYEKKYESCLFIDNIFSNTSFNNKNKEEEINDEYKAMTCKDDKSLLNIKNYETNDFKVDNREYQSSSAKDRDEDITKNEEDDQNDKPILTTPSKSKINHTSITQNDNNGFQINYDLIELNINKSDLNSSKTDINLTSNSNRICTNSIPIVEIKTHNDNEESNNANKSEEIFYSNKENTHNSNTEIYSDINTQYMKKNSDNRSRNSNCSETSNNKPRSNRSSSNNIIVDIEKSNIRSSFIDTKHSIPNNNDTRGENLISPLIHSNDTQDSGLENINDNILLGNTTAKVHNNQYNLQNRLKDKYNKNLSIFNNLDNNFNLIQDNKPEKKELTSLMKNTSQEDILNNINSAYKFKDKKLIVNSNLEINNNKGSNEEIIFKPKPKLDFPEILTLNKKETSFSDIKESIINQNQHSETSIKLNYKAPFIVKSFNLNEKISLDSLYKSIKYSSLN